MTKREKFLKKLQSYLPFSSHSERYLQELNDHLEDKEFEDCFTKKKYVNHIEEMGDPELLAKLYKMKTATEKSTRLMSLIINSCFLLILILTVFNEDGIYTSAFPLITSLTFTILVSFMAWKWKKTGGILTMIGALAIFISVNISAINFNLGVPFGLIIGLLWSIPFIVIGDSFRKAHITIS